MTANSDPAERMARVRHLFAEQQSKMPAVDANGRPTNTPAPKPTPAVAPEDLTAQLEAARQSGDWKLVLQLLHGPRPDNAA